MKARILNGVVGEILTPVEGFALEDCFHHLVIAMCIDIPNNVKVGWIQQKDGSFAEPVIEEPVIETPIAEKST